jgi:hypothetical protein
MVCRSNRLLNIGNQTLELVLIFISEETVFSVTYYYILKMPRFTADIISM